MGIRIGLALALVVASPRADTLHVPGDFGDIQSAVDAAQPGDTVQVAAGLWLGAVHVTKGITLQGVGASVTIIDAAGQGPAVTVELLGSQDAFALRAFTLSGGTGKLDPVFSQISGGGLHVFGNDAAQLLVEDCTITGNAVAGSGGGVYSLFSPLELRDCVVTGNQAGLDGGGMYIGANLGPVGPVEDCVISANGAGHDGGGLWTSGAAVSECRLERNTAGNSGGGLFSTSGFSITDLEIVDNEAVLDDGGAAFSSAFHPGSRLLYAGNHAGRDGGGFHAFRKTGIVGFTWEAFDVECHDNRAERHGGGAAFIGGSAPSLLPLL